MPTTIARARVRPEVRPDQVWRDIRVLEQDRFLLVLQIHEWADEVQAVQVAYNPLTETYVGLQGAPPRWLRRDRFISRRGYQRGYELVRDFA